MESEKIEKLLKYAEQKQRQQEESDRKALEEIEKARSENVCISRTLGPPSTRTLNPNP